MASDKVPGIKRILLGICLIALSAIVAQSEYNTLHSGGWFTNLVEPEMWTTAAIFGVLGIAGIASGIWAWRKSRHD